MTNHSGAVLSFARFGAGTLSALLYVRTTLFFASTISIVTGCFAAAGRR